MNVLLLAGGPDAEHDVSLESAVAVGKALAERHVVHRHVFHSIDATELARLPGDIVFPILHGPWGEGGGMQALLEANGRPYLGAGPAAACLAMDKLETKTLAQSLGITTGTARLISADEDRPELPCVIKPNAEGSSVGLFVVRTEEDWSNARNAIAADETPGRTWLAESLLPGPEFTVPVLDRGSGLEPLPIIRIDPAEGTYDYEAKYQRSDTTYTVNPDLSSETAARMREHAQSLAHAIGVRHLARVDFMLDAQGVPTLLELNTMPGFTAQSLLPKAAASIGLDLPSLVDHLAGLVAHGVTGTSAPLSTGLASP